MHLSIYKRVIGHDRAAAAEISSFPDLFGFFSGVVRLFVVKFEFMS